jgi:LacI family transcriptional regulator
MPVPRLRDVAELAGVHTATASRALNPATRSLVNERTVTRVATAAAQLGYTPNPIARGLKTNRSGSEGIVIPDLTNPLFPPMVRGIDDILSAAGYCALIVNTDNDSEREQTQINFLRGRQVEGIIFGTARLDSPFLERLVAEAVPVVLINRRVETPGITSVTVNDADGVLLGLRHLAALGHRRIAHLAGPQWTSTGKTRLRAYQQGLRDLGLEQGNAELIVMCEAFTESQGAAGFETLLDRDTGCTAVVAGNDLIALGCYDVMQRRGMDCPQTMSVVGFNDMPIVDKLRPGLTTIRIPQYEVGAEAARLLLEKIRSGPTAAKSKSVMLDVELVVRGSTGPPPAG